MARWYTADLHFGHARISEYCSRPFADVAAMNEGLIANWNATVAHEDTVWVLGDVAMGHIAETLPLVRQLHGRKVLVPGNHDRCWQGHGAKAAKWDSVYREAGFAEILHGRVEILLEDVPVRICHFPYQRPDGPCEKYHPWRPRPDGGWLVHGHVHEAWHVRDKQFNVGVDVNDYHPVSVGEILRVIRSSAPA